MPITLGIRVDAVPSLDFVRDEITAALSHEQRWLCTFVNPASVVLSHRQPSFSKLLEAFDRVLPDGSGMVVATRWLHGVSATRVSFDSTSLAPIVFRLAARQQLLVGICGGKPGVAAAAAQRLRDIFGIPVVSCDGYGDVDIARETIGAAAIVVVCMGGFLQEKFLLDLAARGWSGVGLTCGGYLDQLAQKYDYYPRLVDRLNLRFAYRLFREPRRLWRRYLLHYPLFIVWLCHGLLTKEKRS